MADKHPSAPRNMFAEALVFVKCMERRSLEHMLASFRDNGDGTFTIPRPPKFTVGEH